jgi:pyruvate,water dikinase
MENIVWIEQLRAVEVPSAGGKGANLGELASGGFPVPPAFVITADAYLRTMHDAHVRYEGGRCRGGRDGSSPRRVHRRLIGYAEPAP